MHTQAGDEIATMAEFRRSQGLSPIASELLAGGISGSFGIFFSQPLDVARIRLQQSSTKGGTLGGTIREAFASEGVRGLFKGVGSPVLTVGLMNAVLFFSYDRATRSLLNTQQQNLGEPPARLSLDNVFLAGCAAGVATAFITAPTELVKCIAQVDTKSKGNIAEEYQIVKTMVRRHGLFGAHGPTRGLGITICREAPAFGTYFMVYECLSRNKQNNKNKSFWVSFWAGGCAGMVSWAVIYPLDVLKTRWTVAPPGTYTSLRHCLLTSVKREGAGCLLKGFGATMARAFPQNAVVFASYEFISGILGGEN